MSTKFLLASDIDGTLIPHGEDNQSHIRTNFSYKIENAKDILDLCYASGRSLKLILNAIKSHSLPTPKFLITDVGTEIYELIDDIYQPSISYEETLANRIEMDSIQALHKYLSEVTELEKQEPEQQTKFKLSYDTSNINLDKALAQIKLRLEKYEGKIAIVTSSNPKSQSNHVDILPSNANKLHALNFLISSGKYETSKVIYAGDSGNDLAVFQSGIKSIVVNNTDQKTKDTLNKNPKQNQNCYYSNKDVIEGVLEGLDFFGI